MKKSLILLAVSLVGVSSAFADSFVPDELGLSASCSKKIVTKTIRDCNITSKANEGSDRMHPCFESQSGVYSDSAESPTFWVSYTAGDADEYSYKIEITDKTSCKFTFKAE